MVTWTKNRQTSATRNSFEDDDDDEEAEAVVERVLMCVCVPHQSESLQFGNFLFQIELRWPGTTFPCVWRVVAQHGNNHHILPHCLCISYHFGSPAWVIKINPPTKIVLPPFSNHPPPSLPLSSPSVGWKSQYQNWCSVLMMVLRVNTCWGGQGGRSLWNLRLFRLVVKSRMLGLSEGRSPGRLRWTSGTGASHHAGLMCHWMSHSQQQLSHWSHLQHCTSHQTFFHQPFSSRYICALLWSGATHNLIWLRPTG